MPGEDVGVLHHHLGGVGGGIGEGDGDELVAFAQREVGGFARGAGKRLQDRHGGIAGGDGGFAERGKAKDGGAEAVFAGGADLFHEAA